MPRCNNESLVWHNARWHDIHKHRRTHSEALMEFREVEGGWHCLMNDPIDTKCRGPEIIFDYALVEDVMTCNLLFLSTTFF